jgi:hypothetical protein
MFQMDELKYFKGCKTENSVTKRFRELAKKYHPDNNPDLANSASELEELNRMMQEINEEHHEVLILLKYKALEKAESKQKVKKEAQSDVETAPKPARNIVKSVLQDAISLLKLTPQQKQQLANRGKDALNFLYDSVVENNLK